MFWSGETRPVISLEPEQNPRRRKMNRQTRRRLHVCVAGWEAGGAGLMEPQSKHSIQQPFPSPSTGKLLPGTKDTAALLKLPFSQCIYCGIQFHRFNWGSRQMEAVDSDVSPLLRMSGLSVWSHFSTFTLLFFCLVLSPFLSYPVLLGFLKIWYWNARSKQSMVPASPNFICYFWREQYRRD